MEKKILSLSIIVILIVILFTLTGCGNNNQENSGDKSEGKSSNSKLVDLYDKGEVVIGSSVMYDAGTTASYTSPVGSYEGIITSEADIDKSLGKSGNGYKEQTFTANGLSRWIVIGKDEVKNEILIRPYDSLKNDNDEGLRLQGKIGYIYALDELEKICDVYGHGEVASSVRCINIDDINRISGYSFGDVEYKNDVVYDKFSYQVVATVKQTYGADDYSKYGRYANTIYAQNRYWIATQAIDTETNPNTYSLAQYYSEYVSAFDLMKISRDGKITEQTDWAFVSPVVSIKSDATVEKNEKGLYVIKP